MASFQIDTPEWFPERFQERPWLLLGVIASVTAIYTLYGLFMAVYRGMFY